MKRTPFDDVPCSVARALDVVGEWWSFLIIRDVFFGIRRFEPLRKQLGISKKVLSDRLDALVGAGVLERRAYRQTPPRHEYRLTPKGVDLFPILMALTRWGDRWLAGGEGPPMEYVHSKCGHTTQAMIRCARCGEELGAHNLRPRLGPSAAPEYMAALERAAGRKIFLP